MNTQQRAAPSVTAADRELQMTTIFCWGPVEPLMAQIGLEKRRPDWVGNSWFSRWSVWRLNERDFNRLVASSHYDAQLWNEAGCAWRYAPGSNLGTPDSTVMCNGLDMVAWDPPHGDRREYDSLLDYLDSGIGATTESNVAAVVSDLARGNGMTVPELLKRYQDGSDDHPRA